MYCLFFYFSNSDLEKLLEFSDILSKWFEKYFWIKYDWLAWTDTEKFLKIRDGEEKEWNYWVSTINQSWPYNMIRYWDDSFYISTEISWTDLWDLDAFEIEKIKRKFTEEMLEKLPCLWVLSCFEENYEHFSKIFSKEVLEYSTFSAKKENWKIIFFEWKCDIDWFKRDIPTKKERIIWVTIYLTSIFLLFIFIIFVIYYLFKIFL